MWCKFIHSPPQQVIQWALRCAAGISKRINAQVQDAKAKRADYDQEKAQLESAAKAAKNASAALEETKETEKMLKQEKDEIAAKVEKLEDKLAVVSCNFHSSCEVLKNGNGHRLCLHQTLQKSSSMA